MTLIDENTPHLFLVNTGIEETNDFSFVNTYFWMRVD